MASLVLRLTHPHRPDSADKPAEAVVCARRTPGGDERVQQELPEITTVHLAQISRVESRIVRIRRWAGGHEMLEKPPPLLQRQRERLGSAGSAGDHQVRPQLPLG